MKSSFNIDDTVMAEVKREAERQRRTISELVERALRLMLRSRQKRKSISMLPKFHSGGHLVDIADRDAMCDAAPSRQQTP